MAAFHSGHHALSFSRYVSMQFRSIIRNVQVKTSLPVSHLPRPQLPTLAQQIRGHGIVSAAAASIEETSSADLVNVGPEEAYGQVNR